MFPPRLQRWVAAAAAPSWNPQNTTGAQVLPSADFSPEAAVRTQMDALAKCDEPFPGHGLQLMYEWGYDTGGMEPSMYFAFPKDLYHEDHFVGQFQNQLPELVNARSYEIEEVAGAGAGRWVVRVAVERVHQFTRFEFHLAARQVGGRQGPLLTAMIRRLDES